MTTSSSSALLTSPILPSDLMAPTLRTPTAPSGVPGKNLSPEEKMEAAQKAAKEFETQFIGDFIQHLFKGVDEKEGLFGGGQMEGMFRHIWAEKLAENIAKSGFGIAESILPTLLRDSNSADGVSPAASASKSSKHVAEQYEKNAIRSI